MKQVVGADTRMSSARGVVARSSRAMRSWIDALARRRLLTCVAVGLLAMCLRLALLPLWGLPQPAVEDEFSYLLQGETFADGRLTNPAHPLSSFFEAIHVNVKPTYAGKYPPGQAIFLALGIRLFGHPWYGVLISVGFMCACICWMVQGWLPPRYALLAGVTSALQFAGDSYWVNSYWGGAVAAAGGAVLLGALPRILRKPSASVLAAAAVGIVILLNTRPYEGSVLIVACSITIVWRLGLQVRHVFQPRRIAGAFLVLSVGAGAMAFYNWRVTGDPAELPYMVHQRRYALAPLLWVLPRQQPKNIVYRDKAMRDLWVWDLHLYERARANPVNVVYALCASADDVFLNGPMEFLIGFAGIGFLIALRRESLRPASAVGVMFVCGVLLEKFILPHYLAPATALVFLFMAAGLRRLWVTKFVSLRVGPLAAVFVIGMAGAVFAAQNVHRIDPLESYPLRPRVDAAKQLSRMPGRHVVFVRYSPAHDYSLDYVYNGPDIDSQKIVWAIDRGVQANTELQRYYPRRTFWLLMPDEPRPYLKRYSTEVGRF